jgi:hypothetical protein
MKIYRNQLSIVRPILVFSFSTALSGAVLAATEDPQTRAAESIRVPVVQFIPEELITDPTYQLQPEATIHRSYATFQLKTDSGTTQIMGTNNLLERIAELKAIETLKKIKKTDVYMKALKSSALGPMETVKGLINEPVDTISEAAKGLGGLLADVGYSIVSDDPSQENVAKLWWDLAQSNGNLLSNWV